MNQINKILETIKEQQNGNKRIITVGITGQAGAGKTHISKKISDNIPHSVMDFDWFFKLSRNERSRWLEEGKKISVEEWKKRTDQNKWWDFQKAHKTIESIKRSIGTTFIIENAYNRSDNGELNGIYTIAPKADEILIIEGVPIILLGDAIDVLVYIHANDAIRKKRINERDGKTRIDLKAEERWLITQHFETKIFKDNLDKIDYIINNSEADARYITKEDLELSLKKQKETLPELRPIYY